MSVTIQVFFFNGTPSYFELPLMIESTFDVKSATETKPLSADYGDAGIPKKIFVTGISLIYYFHAFSRLPISAEEY
jgi:hypothetical protein